MEWIEDHLPVRFLIAGIAAAAVAALAVPPGALADTHDCPAHRYWDNIVVHDMGCRQATRVHRQKLADCTYPTKRVTPTAYVYTCYFGPWISTERVGRHSFSDRIYIRRSHGRSWMRYGAVP
jgi:hypothetical protein